MSTSKNSLSKLGGTEVVTGVNLVGLVFLYYKFYEMGVDLNGKIAALAGVTKKIMKNVNIVNMHLKHHLYKHKTELDVENDNQDDSLIESNYTKEDIEEILSELAKLKSRIEVLEETSNPINKEL